MSPRSVFPAYAGMIPLQSAWGTDQLRVPRIRGDDPVEALAAAFNIECSPHTRG